MDDAWKWGLISGGGCCGVLVITIIVLIAVSFATLEPDEYGLDFNGVTQHVDETTLYEEGRYFLGLGHSFIVLPRTVQTNEIANVQVRTVDGLVVSLSASYQWRLPRSAEVVAGVYFLFKDEYSRAFDKIASNLVRDVAARWGAFDFYFNRTQIQSAMRDELDKVLQESLGVQVESYQLRNFDMPAPFEREIELTEQKRQGILKTLQEQQRARIDAESKVNVARENANVIRVQAQADRDAFLFERVAEADSINATIAAEKQSYGALQRALGLDAEQLATFVWLRSVQDTTASQLIAVPTPPGVASVDAAAAAAAAAAAPPMSLLLPLPVATTVVEAPPASAVTRSSSAVDDTRLAASCCRHASSSGTMSAKSRRSSAG